MIKKNVLNDRCYTMSEMARLFETRISEGNYAVKKDCAVKQ